MQTKRKIFLFPRSFKKKWKKGERIRSTAVQSHMVWTEDFILLITGQENTTTNKEKREIYQSNDKSPFSVK